jgi:hypothetical protein
MQSKEIVVVTATPEHKAEYIRLPRARERDPIFGLSRTCLNSLVLPTPLNDFQPLVRSFVIRKPGAQTGVRLILVSSLRAYIEGHEQEAGQPCRATSMATLGPTPARLLPNSNRGLTSYASA